MADVKWVKIVTNIFDDEKILLIEDMPEADSIIVIWFKLLCLTGKQNNSGVLMMNDKLAYTESMLATLFRRKPSTINLALRVFEGFGMIEIIEDVITIPNWEKHQSTDKLDRLQEQNRLRQSKYRENQKQIACKTKQSDDVDIEQRYSNVTVTEQNKNKKKELDKDIDKDIFIVKESKQKTKKQKLIEIVDTSDFSDPVKKSLLEWLEYKNYDYKEIGVTKLLTTIRNKDLSDDVLIFVIDNSIASNYKGIIFDLAKNYKENLGKKGDEFDEFADLNIERL